MYRAYQIRPALNKSNAEIEVNKTKVSCVAVNHTKNTIDAITKGKVMVALMAGFMVFIKENVDDNLRCEEGYQF